MPNRTYNISEEAIEKLNSIANKLNISLNLAVEKSILSFSPKDEECKYIENPSFGESQPIVKKPMCNPFKKEHE